MKNVHRTGVRGIPEEWDEEIEVVVVGSGFAGLAAAAEAAGLGARVVILEKMRRYGGNSLISGGGYCAWDSELHLRQRLDLGFDTWRQHQEDTLKGGDYYNIPGLVEVMVKGAPDGLNWLIDAGARIKKTLPRIGGHSAHRSHLEAASQGRGFTEPLKKLATSRGVEIRLNTSVTGIWREDAEGPVLGVEAVTEEKKNIRVSRALVLASGGFSRDVKMRMDYNPSLVPEYNCTNHRGATGEIIRYARAVWADVLHLAFIQLYPCAEPKSGAIDSYALHPYSGTGYGLFYVNKFGRRFVNELDRRDVVSDAQIKSGGKPTYAILNAEVFEKLATPADEIRKGVAKGRLIEGETINELAEKLGIPKDALEDSVARHNRYIMEGRDLDFGKPMTANMVALTKGPFYGIAQWPAIHHCMGGLRIDKEARVIDIWGRPIPRLYAAGEVCGGIHGSNRLGGNAIPDCIVFGRIAGINAAKEK
ncbi:MAG: Urocanate reductase precursor [Syntrophorhabdaceae bacterium PtaU1.Bin034]|nr:MAG: Urocanate reductase precursor [Syntrophorhabdaceae bacterium PtaU1.Bin034]